MAKIVLNLFVSIVVVVATDVQIRLNKVKLKLLSSLLGMSCPISVLPLYCICFIYLQGPGWFWFSIGKQ